MKTLVASFIRMLRKHGVRVSPDESVDALKGLYYVGMNDRARFKSVLQMTLIKSEKDLNIFDEMFELFFKIATNVTDHQLDLPSELVQEAAIAIKHLAEGEKQHEGGEHSGFKLMIQTQELDDVEIDLDDFELIERELGIGNGLSLNTNIYLGERLASPNPNVTYSTGELKYFVDEEKLEQWKQKNFLEYSDDEIDSMDELVAQFVNRLKKDIKKMQKKKSDGKLFVTRTLRKNSRYGMVPFKPHYKKRNKEKPRMIVLCDISYSVSHAARFLLHLMHSLQNTVLSVRSFVFVKDIIEVTEVLKKFDMHVAMDKIASGEMVDVDENSDYGHAFLTFQKNFLESMKGQPAVLILGDARNNYNQSNSWVLEEMKEKAGLMMWLTPEKQTNWEMGDCCLQEYGEHVDAIEVVRNMVDLSRVVEKLVRNIYRGVGNTEWWDEGSAIIDPEEDFGMAIFRNTVTQSATYDQIAKERMAAHTK